MADALGAAHGRPVVLVFDSTKQADLIELPVGGAPWPGKFVRTTTQEKNVQQLLWHGSRLLPATCAGTIIMHWKPELG
jgi:hypothetical protein